MSETRVESVYYVDGCVIESDYVYIASKLHSLDPEEYDYSRMSFLDRDSWIYHDLNWDVLSVCVKQENDAEPRSYCALSAQGDVELQYLGGANIEKIPEAGTYEGLGAVKQIREIGGHLYVCGDQGQVYQRAGIGRWEHIDNGILDREISASALDFNSIDGTCDDDIYVVGYHGKIYYRTNSKWHEIDSPTNAHLERVRCVSSDEVYICGNKGVFLKGNKHGFEDLTIAGLDDHLWGLECYEGKIYLASLGGLYVYDGQDVSELKTGLEPKIGGYRLDSRDGVLWSFGVDDVASFDGNSWTRVLHPDNS